MYINIGANNGIEKIMNQKKTVTSGKLITPIYVGGSISFRRDIQRPRQMQNALRDI